MAKGVTIREVRGRKRVSATDARVHFGELMQRVKSTGETIYVDKGSETMMKLVSVEPGEVDEETEPKWWRDWKAIQEEMRVHRGGRPLAPTPEELIRADRDSR